MIFYEEIGFIAFFKILLTKKKLFYNKKSLIVKFIEKCIPLFSENLSYMNALNYGDLQYATNVMKNAYINARSWNDNLHHEKFFNEGANLFDIDFLLVFRKFILNDVLFKKYEFFELAMHYADEHPYETHVFYVKSQYISGYFEQLSKYGKVLFIKNNPRVKFFVTLLLIPLIFKCFFKIFCLRKSIVYNSQILCNVNGESTNHAFHDLFGEYSRTQYLITSTYVNEFSNQKLSALRIHLLKPDLLSYKYLKKNLWQFVFVFLRCNKELSVYGSDILLLFKMIIVGRVEAPHGKGNIYFSFEHFNTTRAIRNEFIRLEGSKSVFFTHNPYPYTHYHPLETFNNYDFLCSSGRHIEELYLEKFAKTDKFLKTGSYTPHKRIINLGKYPERLKKLQYFKGKNVSITILSPGICDETYSNELRLMKLTQKLSHQYGLKIFVRLKPVPLIPKYANFYDPFVKNEQSIMLTGAEYELFDFVAVTDLFVTSISSSACDIALCGGQVMFVDFMKTPDRYLFWEVMPDVVISKEDAFGRIMNWVNDDVNGPMRANHKRLMDRFVKYIGYNYHDFEGYKTNILKLLRENVFCDNPAFKDI